LGLKKFVFKLDCTLHLPRFPGPRYLLLLKGVRLFVEQRLPFFAQTLEFPLRVADLLEAGGNGIVSRKDFPLLRFGKFRESPRS
jgi:hypothetical protein